MDFGFYYRPGREPDAVPLSCPTPAARPAATTRTSARAGSPATSGSPTARSRRRSSSAPTGRGRTTASSSWTETRPVGFTRTYYGTSVYDGSLPYNGTLVTPSWGGSMFEALMPSLFVPEEEWAPGSWGANHPLVVDAQIHHGLVEAGYGYWGFSPSNVPEGGYRTYGVDGIGTDSGGYPSNNDGTLIDHGWARLPRRPAGAARPAAERLHQRRRHAARRVPGAALPAGRGAGRPAPARARLRHLHAARVPGLGERRQPAWCRTRTCRSTRA